MPRKDRFAKLCSIEGCGRPMLARGWCGGHWARWKRTGSPQEDRGVRVFGLPLLDRFNAKVTRGEGDECWLWTGGTVRGYGNITIPMEGGGFRHMYATHLALLVLRGIEVPDGMLVMHSCDNPPCVNPDHLSVGTDLDNVRDMIAKGRANNTTRVRGEAVNTARLTADQVRDIRMAYAYGATVADLMIEYAMGRHAIDSVVRRISWKHVE